MRAGYLTSAQAPFVSLRREAGGRLKDMSELSMGSASPGSATSRIQPDDQSRRIDHSHYKCIRIAGARIAFVISQPPFEPQKDQSSEEVATIAEKNPAVYIG